MDVRNRIRILLLLGAVVVVALGFSPAPAVVGGMACEIAGQVHLDNPENLGNVDGGKGQLLAPTPPLPNNIACVGSVTGRGSVSGAFAFCGHTSSTVHTAQCTGVVNFDGNSTTADPPPPQTPEEPVFNALGAIVAGNPITAGRPLVAHVVASFNFTITPVSGPAITCSFLLNGHTGTTIANLSLLNFSCSNGFTPGPSAQVRAQAVAVPIVLPGPFLATCPSGAIPLPPPLGGQPQGCFQDLVFEGAMDIASAN